MLKFTSALDLGRVITDITLTATITRTGMGIIGRTIGTVAIVTTATTGIITTIGTKLTEYSKHELARKRFRASNFLVKPTLRVRYFFELGESGALVPGLLAG